MFHNKKIIILDIDGTVADSYGPIYPANAVALSRLLQKGAILAFATDRSRQSIEEKVIALLPDFERYRTQIYMLPAAGSALYEWNTVGWDEIYENRIDWKNREEIISTYKNALREVDEFIMQEYEPFILDKDGLMLSCAAMPEISDRKKRLEWDVDHTKREAIVRIMQQAFPELEIHIGGSTTINIAKEGMNKAYGVRRLLEHLNMSKKDALFLGDAMHVGGNDRPVKDMGVESVHIKNPAHTVDFLDALEL